MTELPDWAEGLPVVADARCGRRYIKADDPQIEDIENNVEEELVGQSEPPGASGHQSNGGFNGTGGSTGGNGGDQPGNDFKRYPDRSFEEGRPYHLVRTAYCGRATG